jgi:hypothetical protein
MYYIIDFKRREEEIEGEIEIERKNRDINSEYISSLFSFN